MFSMLPTLHTHNNPSHYYTPVIPSPLSSSPLRNSPSPLSARDANVPSSPSPECDADAVMSSPSKPPTSTFGIANSNSNFASSGEMANENHAMSMSNKKEITQQRPQAKQAMITPPQTKRHDSVYSKRTTKSNPLLHSASSRSSSNEGRETRRKLFLKRVRDVADEKRWRDRGLGGNGGMGGGEEEEIMRCIWMQEERKREERRRREALGVDVGGVGELGEEFVEEAISLDEMMAEEVARDEEREMEEYLERIPDSSTNHSMMQDQNHDTEGLLFDMESSYRMPTTSRTETLYGSDDDEYDEIFMDVIEEEQRMSSQYRQQLPRQPTPAYVDADEMMDMS